MVNQPIRIAVDAMGGDYAPSEIVAGAVEGARLNQVGILLVGQPEAVETELRRHDVAGLDIRVVPASDVIAMDESPAVALRRKKDASIVITARCVKSGEAQGMVAAGSTGAAMGAALLYIGRIPGVDRPAIGVLLPSSSTPCLLLDAGANADCTPDMLNQFAVMGHIYMQTVQGVSSPRVALLNIGEEAGKGNDFAHAAFKLLSQDSRFRFTGNVEGKELFSGVADVAVTDGFTGNVALKSAEGVMKMFGAILRREMSRTWRSKLGYVISEPAFKASIRQVDPEEFGGALLLGINGVCVISHGGSHARAIRNAIRVAKESVAADVLGQISNQIREGIESHEQSSSPS